MSPWVTKSLFGNDKLDNFALQKYNKWNHPHYNQDMQIIYLNFEAVEQNGIIYSNKLRPLLKQMSSVESLEDMISTHKKKNHGAIRNSGIGI
jgi:hypothetical protein